MLTVCLVGIACGTQPPEQGEVGAESVEPEAYSVYVVNYPLAFFAERIGGELVSVSLPVPAGVDPGAWVPSALEIGDYQRADLILLNGGGYATWVERATLPASRIVDTSQAFSDRFLGVEGETHSHGPAGEHSHAGFASGFWLDPRLAILQAEAIEAGFVSRWPHHEESFERGLASLRAELEALDVTLKEAWEALDDRVVFIEPLFAYLARRYELRSESVDLDRAGESEQAAMRELPSLLSIGQSAVVLSSALGEMPIVAELESAGVLVVLFETLQTRPAQGDFLETMDGNVSRLVAASAN